MGLPVDCFDKSKHNYLQRCFYIINLLKDKDYDLWENFHAQYCATKPEESWELFTMLLDEYQKLIKPVKAIKAPKKKVTTPRSKKKAA